MSMDVGPRDSRRLGDRQRQQTADAIRAYAGLAAVGQLSTMVFRQLDHPLRQAQTELKRLQRTLRLGRVEDDDVPTIRSTVDRVATVLEDLQKRMDRLEPLAAVTETRAVRTAVKPCVEAVLQAFSEEVEGLGIVHEIVGTADAEAEIAPAPIQQALANIVDNAVYWLASRRDNRRLIVEVEPAGLRIWNNGPAIPAEDRALIFEPHYTRREGVPGLGLTVARDLVATAGGTLAVLDVPEGAAFRINFQRPLDARSET